MIISKFMNNIFSFFLTFSNDVSLLIEEAGIEQDLGGRFVHYQVCQALRQIQLIGIK